MKRYSFAVILFAFLFSIIFSFVQAGEKPSFVREKIKMYNADYSDRYAWARLWAWGDGTLIDGKKFLWVSYTNSDGYLQFSFDFDVKLQDVIEITRVEDIYQRNWSVHKGESWIGTSNDWIDNHCKSIKKGIREYEWDCNYTEALNSTISIFKKFSFITKMRIIEYLK